MTRKSILVWSQLKAALAGRAPELRVRRNYPYAGKGDGMTRFLRRRYPASRYVGIELELNQAFVREGGAAWRRLRESVAATLESALPQAGRRARAATK